MKSLLRLLMSLLMVLAILFLVGCTGGPGCPAAQFGASTCTPGAPGIGSGGSSGGGGGGTGGSGGGGTGGGGGGGGSTVDASQAAALVYYGDISLAAAGVTTSGTFGALSSYTPVPLGGVVPDDMMIVDKQFIYVPTGTATVVGYSIDRQTGALTAITGSPFALPGGVGTADDVASDPLGRFLFVGSETAPAIWVYQINSVTGVLTPTAGSPFTAGLSGAGVADILTVDVSGKFLYAGQINPALGVGGFTIDQTTGALTAMTGSPFTGVAVAQIHASPTAELLLGVQEVQDGTTTASDTHIYVYPLDVNTGIPLTPALSTQTLAAPFDFAISPNGSYVYALEASSGADAPIEGFTLNAATGVLTSTGTFSGVPTAEGCEFDQSGIYLFCTDSILAGTTLTVNVANPSTGALTHGSDLASSSTFPFAVTD
jgi:6-phosphogluconolactonase